MTTADLAYQKLQVMTETVQQQVLDYIDYLLQKWQEEQRQDKVLAEREA